MAPIVIVAVDGGFAEFGWRCQLSVSDERGEERGNAGAVRDWGDGGEPGDEQHDAEREQRKHGDGLRGVASMSLCDSSEKGGIVDSQVTFDLVDLAIHLFGVHRSPPATPRLVPLSNLTAAERELYDENRIRPRLRLEQEHIRLSHLHNALVRVE